MNNKIIICILALLASTAICFGQDKNYPNQILSGKLTGIDGEIVSATIRTKKNGMTITLPDGSFSIHMKTIPDTLTFIAIGYVTITKIVNRIESLQLKMTPNVQALNEVVVQTGYQTLRANEINGTVSVISEQAINSTTGTNILDRILNQSSGLMPIVNKTLPNPQSRTNISIRGLGTIDGPSDPLIVLDGFIYEGDINNISPNDIENVSILKDASASSIWGARAGNGVIVITSKRGKLNQPLQVGFSANTLIESLPDLMAISQMETKDYIDLEKNLFDRGYFNNQIISTPFRALTPAVEMMLQQRQGKLTEAELQEKLDYLSTQDSRKNYLNEFYTKALTQQYGMSLRGGATTNSYFISGNYDHSLAENFAKSGRLNLKLTHDIKLGKKLSLSSLAGYTAVNTHSGRPAFGSITTGNRSPVYLNFRDPNGSPIPIDRNFRGAYTDTAARGKLLDWKYYPTEDYLLAFQTMKREEFFASGTLKYKFTSYLQLDLGYQHQQQRTQNIATNNADSYFARNLVNTYSQFNYTTQQVKYIVPLGGIRSNRYTDVSSSTVRAQLNLDKKIGIHAITAILGAEARGVRSETDGSQRYGYYEDPMGYAEIDAANRYPEFLTKSNTFIGGGTTLLSTHYRFLSFYGNFSYSYQGKYHLSASARKDGSNIFGANTNDRWKPLWSAGLGWSISNESFYDFPFLPILNIKATYGHSGNVDMTKTALPIAGYGTDATSGLRTARIGSINNPELKWEQLSQLDIKLDFATKKNKLNGTISYYIKKGTDLYGSAPYDYTTWGKLAELTRNVAAMEGHGMDLELRGKIIDHKFKWNTDLFFSINESKTTAYYRPTGSTISHMLNAGNRITPIIGMPLYGIAAYKWGGLNASGDPQGYLNGELSTNYNAISNEARTTGDNLVFIGRSNPLYFGALINTFSYDHFSLSININFRLAYYFMKSSINYSSLIGSGTSHGDYAKRWQQPGDEQRTHVPAFAYPANSARDAFYTSSAVHVDRADHARLGYIRLAYTPNIATWGIGLRKLEFFSALQNAGILWRKNKDGIDPDYNNLVPPNKQVSFGLRGSF